MYINHDNLVIHIKTGAPILVTNWIDVSKDINKCKILNYEGLVFEVKDNILISWTMKTIQDWKTRPATEKEKELWIPQFLERLEKIQNEK